MSKGTSAIQDSQPPAVALVEPPRRIVPFRKPRRRTSLYQCIERLRRGSDGERRTRIRDPYKLVEAVVRWAEAKGGRLTFYGLRAFLSLDRSIYEIPSPALDDLLQDEGKIVPGQHESKVLREGLASYARKNGSEQRPGEWMMLADGALYIQSLRNQVVRVAPGGVEGIENVDNAYNVALRVPDGITPFDYDDRVSPREAVEALRRGFTDVLSCSPEGATLVTSWLLTAPFRRWTRAKPLVKLSGGQGSGKTTAAALCSTLLYGDDLTSNVVTDAALYERGERFVLLSLDNIESNAPDYLVEFLLGAASGQAKEKRVISADRGTIRLAPDCLVLLNGIETPRRSELRQRIFEVTYERSRQRPGFVRSDAEEELRGLRSVIWSGLLKLFAKRVIGRRYEIAARVRQLQAWAPEHPKGRSFEYVGAMTLVLEALAEHGFLLRPWEEEVCAWLRDQQPNEEPSWLERYLDAVMDELPPSAVARDGDAWSFRAKAGQVLASMQRIARSRSDRLPVQDAENLVRHIHNAEEALAAAGWTIEPTGKSGNATIYLWTRTRREE